MTRTAEFLIGERTLVIAHSDITHVVAEALVSSDDVALSAGGGVSASIASAAGPSMWRDVSKHSPIDLGSVVATTAGELDAKYVLHAAMIDYDAGGYPDAELVRAVTVRCFSLAEKLGVRSIVFPALGSGVGNVPVDECAVAMAAVMAEALTRRSSVVSATLALWPREVVTVGEVDRAYERAVASSAVNVQTARTQSALGALQVFTSGIMLPHEIASPTDGFQRSVEDTIDHASGPEIATQADNRSLGFSDDTNRVIETAEQALAAPRSSSTLGLETEIRRTQQEALRLLFNTRVADLQLVTASLVQEEHPGIRSRMEGLEKEIAFIVHALEAVATQTDAAREERHPTDELMRSPESVRLEFKSCARWNLHAGQVDGAIELAWLKAVAGLMNAEGGTLLIGVADDGSVVGLRRDLDTFTDTRHDPVDTFQNWVVSRLGSSLGMDKAALVRVGIESVKDGLLCRIDVQQGGLPAYLSHKDEDGALYVRFGNTTRRLNTEEAVSYVSAHW